MQKSSLNKVILVGRLGQNPEQKQLPTGTPVASVSLATTQSVKRANEWQDETEWHRLKAFGNNAEYMGKYLSKGQLVSCEGRLKTSKWQDKQNITHYMTEVIIESITALDKSSLSNGNGNTAQTHQQPTNAPQGQNPPRNNDDDEELPF